jgi:hypothetical protein
MQMVYTAGIYVFTFYSSDAKNNWTLYVDGFTCLIYIYVTLENNWTVYL